MAILGMAFAPLHSLTPNADSIIQKFRERIQAGSESGEYSPGLQKQLALQLENLTTKQPGCEMGVFPGSLSFPSRSCCGVFGIMQALIAFKTHPSRTRII